MSQWKRTLSGGRRRPDSMGKNRPQDYSLSPCQQPYPPQSPEGTSSCQSSVDDRSSSTCNQPPNFAARPRTTPEAVLTHPAGPFRTPSTPFTLPSLSPTHPAAYTLPPISVPSPGPSQFGSLAHDHGANVATIQTLQRENAALVSSYSSAQVRITDLDEEARASKLEIAKLIKDRQRLKAKIDVLEAEVDELQSNIEISQQHTAAKDAQYSQIVELSTKLQNQGTADANQHKVAQERWAHEKQDMENLLKTLSSEIEDLRRNFRRSTAPHSYGSDHQQSRSAMIDREEASSGSSAEDALVALQKEHAYLMDCIGRLGTIGKNMQTHVRDIGPRENSTEYT